MDDTGRFHIKDSGHMGYSKLTFFIIKRHLVYNHSDIGFFYLKFTKHIQKITGILYRGRIQGKDQQDQIRFFQRNDGRIL